MTRTSTALERRIAQAQYMLNDPDPTVALRIIARQLAELRKQRDELIRAHPGTLREIAEAAGLSFQQVGNIKNRKEEK